MAQQLVIERLRSIKPNPETKGDVLRQLIKKNPNFTPSDIIINANILLNENKSRIECQKAYDFLKPLIPLETSYCSSAGPVGTFYETLTIWEEPKKPFGSWRFTFYSALVAFIIAFTAHMVGVELLAIVIYTIFLWLMTLFLFNIVIIPEQNKFRAYEELRENITRDARWTYNQLMNNQTTEGQPLVEFNT